MEPAPRSLKRVVDPVNTMAWFAMDALWLFKLEWPAYAFAAVTVATGLWLLVLGWRSREGRDALLADLGLNCWIAMNTIWMVSDLVGYEKPPQTLLAVVAVSGAGFLAAAALTSQDLRRVRLRGR